ncbi:ABC transporter ATP-binding protein [Salidesulfovibrio brasiliensis]|uniref:ABC transporter ATP-binding protein n=1 Tax=Salidesulfovibrio brasiliensis TaxID=221711 RepID=UPI000AD6EBCC
MAQPILEIRDLTTSFASAKGVAKAVDTVSLSVMQGETLAIVGESGCGKSVLALSVMGLVPDPPGRITDGTIHFKGREVTAMTDDELREMRGNHVSMVFQEPMTALNPVFKVGEQIAEAVRLHMGLSREEADARAVETLRLTGVPHPERVAKAFPHELSGGLRQRVVIAIALACEPELLLADEPTTALDVTIQAQVLQLMADLKAKMSGSLVLITHDLGVVASMADRVAVMYAGIIVEQAEARACSRNRFTLTLPDCSNPSPNSETERP